MKDPDDSSQFSPVKMFYTILKDWFMWLGLAPLGQVLLIERWM